MLGGGPKRAIQGVSGTLKSTVIVRSATIAEYLHSHDIPAKSFCPRHYTGGFVNTFAFT